MRWLRHILLGTGCLVAGCSLAFAQSEEWLPVTPHDLQLTEVAEAPQAPAVLLYYADHINFASNQTEFFYSRIKVLSEAGRSYADVEIPVYPGAKIHDLQARTIHPDGTVIDLAVQPFEKVIVKAHGIKFLEDSFTLPQVTVGSIVEYKYKLQGHVRGSNQWILEQRLFAVKEHFLFKYGGSLPVSFLVSGTKVQPTSSKGVVELEMRNVPPFTPEEQMPPEGNYKATVRFFWSWGGPGSANIFWGLRAAAWGNFFEDFIGNHKEVRKAAAAAVGNETDLEEKLRRLYARAQNMRNLAYERERTEAEQKQEQIKAAKNVADVLAHEYGSHDDINALFVALARAAGFDASVVLVSNRSEWFFVRDYLNGGQYDSVIADVRFNGKDLYLDPGTKLCPFGLLRWIRTSTAALRLQRGGGVFFDLPAAREDKAVLLRTARLVLNADGSAKGEVTVRYEEGEALEHRLLSFESDEAGRKKAMEEELKQSLPPQTSVTMTNSMGWKDQDGPLIANFTIEIPSYAVVAGKRILAPTSAFATKQKDTFKSAERKYPIYFPYAFSEFDTVVIQVPEGFAMEHSPEPEESKSPFGQYRNNTKTVEGQIITSRVLQLKQFLFDPKMYADLKTFFGKVQAADEAQAVLRQGEAATSHKEN